MNLNDLYEMRDPRDAYERDVANSTSGFGKDSQAYRADGGANDERHDLDQESTTWYIRLNGKLIKDKSGNPYSFQNKAAANKAALTMQAKLFNKDKEFMLTTNPNDKSQGVAEAQQLSVQQLATVSDAALDKAYGYGRSQPGNSFGWQANLKSAAFAKQMIDKGVTDIEAISDAIHKGWNTTAQAFVQNPEQFDDTAKLKAAGKLEAKLQQRAQLMKQNYGQLPEEEKEKDRVVARALLQALKGEQDVMESKRNKQRRLNEAMLMEDPVYRKFKRVGQYIAERRMSEKEILQVFADAETGMTDKGTGANRTFLGRGKDTTMDFAGGVADALKGVWGGIQKSVPVAAVDVAYDQATDALANLVGGQKGAVMQAIKKYRMLAKQYPKTAGLAKAALVGIAGLATGGAGLPAVAALVYGLDSSIKGDKLSDIALKAGGAAATAWAAGKIFGGPADVPADDGTTAGIQAQIDAQNAELAPNGVATDAVPSRFDQIVDNAVNYKIKQGDTLSDILADRKINPEAFKRLPGNEVYFSADGNPNIIKAGQTIKLPDPADINDLNKMSWTTPSDPNIAKTFGDKDFYTGQYNQNSVSGLDATNNLRQQEFGRLGSDNGMAAARVAQDAGGQTAGMSQAEIAQMRNQNLFRMQDQADAAYYADKPDDFGINPRNNDAVGTGMPGSAPSGPSLSFPDGGNTGTLTLPDGRQVQAYAFPEGGIQPRLGLGLEKVPVNYAGQDVTAYIVNGKAYIKNFNPQEFSNPVQESWLPAVQLLKLPANQLIDKKTTILNWKLNESIGRKSKTVNLTTVGAYTVFENVDRYRKAIMEKAGVPGSTRPEYYRPDMMDAPTKPDKKPGLIGRGLNALDRGVKKVGSALGTFGRQFTTNVTKEKLKMNWQQAGKPSDSDQLATWLVGQGVPQEVVTSVFSKMSIPYTAPASGAQQPALTGGPTAGLPPATGRAPAATPSAGAFSNMAGQLAKTPTTSSTGGTTSVDLAKGITTNRASANNPNQQAATGAATPANTASTAGKFPGEDPTGPNYVGRLEVKRRQAARAAAAGNSAAKPTAPQATSTTAGAPSKVTYSGLLAPKKSAAPVTDFSKTGFSGYQTAKAKQPAKQPSMAEGYVPINIYKGPPIPAPEPKKVERDLPPKYDPKVHGEVHDLEWQRQQMEKRMYNVVRKSDGKVINPEPIKGYNAAEEFRFQNGLAYWDTALEEISTLRFHVTGVDSNGKVVNSEPLLSMKDVSDFYKQHGINQFVPTTRVTPTGGGVEEGKLAEAEVDSDGYSMDHADSGEYDYEGDQARDQMNTIVRAARRLNGMLDDNENMPEWVQMKVTLAADYLDTAADYIESNQEPELAEDNHDDLDNHPDNPKNWGGDHNDQAMWDEKHGVAEGEKVGNMDADKFDAAMARLKQLAGAGPMKTVYDPAKRVYRNVPVAVQPKR
jgi:hypothetical protein